jgi:membrane-associated phospholipid phosphatase
MALSQRLSPADRLVAGYNLILALVWLPLAPRATHASWIAAAHLAAAGLPWLLERVPRRRWGVVVALRDLYPLILVAGFWSEIDVFRRTIGPGNYDHLIAPLDRAVFGTHLHEIWMPAMDWVWLSETMFFMYGAYYALIGLPLIIVAIQGRRAALRDMVFRLLVAYLACYLLYIPFPVDGPHFLYQPHAGPHTDGFFYQLIAGIQGSGDSRGCAFPSSHVTGAVAIAIYGWRWFSRPVAILLTLEAFGVVVSTVYTQNHYAIDSLSGVVVGVALQLFAVPLLHRALGGAPARVPLGLPDFAPVWRRVNTPESSR